MFDLAETPLTSISSGQQPRTAGPDSPLPPADRRTAKNAAGGPPAVPAIGALFVWEVLWVLMAVAALTDTTKAAHVTASR